MQSTHQAERVTISLPADISREVEELKKELHMSKSEIFKRAIEKFLQDYNKQRIHKISEMMASEYKSDKELTALTCLDKEDFR